jgi:diaminohydroxyphosphoribosylaminopyrimidine deaminase / 5-amino-6-(5-phosphoribosylamino)uracil reductase
MVSQFTEFDRFAMRRALELAARGLSTTHPNPRVGCVIARGERIIAEGWHERAGEAHAEVVALRVAAEQAAGSTAYVTLEPCSHFGRTPPCVDALIAAKIRRVVFALQDPNPRVSGQGAEKLRQAGIAVHAGLLEDEAAELNVGFVKRMKTGRPWVRLKLAMSLDGRTALANGASRWITCEAAREDVQHWRARSSAVLTGIGTVLADDPRLDVRLSAERRQPLRVVVDTQLRTPPESRLLQTPGEVLIFTAATNPALRSALEARGARVEVMGGAGRLDLHAVMTRLGTLEMNEVFAECGATLAGELIRASLVDELLVYVAPLLVGPQGRPLVLLPELHDLGAARRFEIIECSRIGQDARLRLRS